MNHTLSTADQLRGIHYAHELLNEALGLNKRRDTYIKPEYLADMSRLNAELDTILNGDQQ